MGGYKSIENVPDNELIVQGNTELDNGTFLHARPLRKKKSIYSGTCVGERTRNLKTRNGGEIAYTYVDNCIEGHGSLSR